MRGYMQRSTARPCWWTCAPDASIGEFDDCFRGQVMLDSLHKDARHVAVGGLVPNVSLQQATMGH